MSSCQGITAQVRVAPVSQLALVVIIVWRLDAVSVEVIIAQVLVVIPLLQRSGGGLVEVLNLQRL